VTKRNSVHRLTRPDAGACRARRWLRSAGGCLAIGIAVAVRVDAQVSPLFPTAWFQAIRGEATGEIPAAVFRHIVTHYSGFAPSKGGDEIADYIAGRMREFGLDQVAVEGFPADGKAFFWAFKTEPAWEAETGILELVQPRRERMADFAVDRVVLGRFSSTADVTADLVDVGRGVAAADYDGRDVKGKLVLASGAAGRVHEEAVWRRGAAGVVWIHEANAIERPMLVSNPGIVPWTGPGGEAPGFAFGISYAAGAELKDMLAHGDRVRLHATVKATMGPGEYKQVTAVIPGTDASAPEVWIKGHDNYRNTGGGNNLTGVGATIEIARVLHKLVADGTLPRPRRTIRFLWSAEHYGSIYQFYKHPERIGRALALLNVDMVGYHQERAKAIFRLYTLPYSRPHFLSDVTDAFVQSVGLANSISIRNRGMESPGFYDAIFAPTGSRDQMHYNVEPFWGPSDHEDVLDGSIALPAVLYNDWPDIYLGTQLDDLDKVDPTQMRRAVLAVASTAYYLASVGPEGLPALTEVVANNALVRLAREQSRAYFLVAGAPAAAAATQYAEARNVLAQWQKREHETLDSLRQLGLNDAARDALSRATKRIDAAYASAEAAWRESVAAVPGVAAAQQAGRTAGDHRLSAIVPRRNPAIRGPVNVFRPEYGAMWLAEKTGDRDFLKKVPLAARGQYVTYEALNFIDGKRSVLEIRDALSAEYGAIDPLELEQFFRFLAGVGVVSLETSSGGK
jgi:aminopeptidase YwaD